MESLVAIGRKVRRLRRALDITQAELAERSGVSTPTIWRLENGVHATNLKTLVAVADVLGISVSELIFGNSDSEAA